MTPSACPTADGVIAPGLCASYTVSFTPDSLSDYHAELKVRRMYSYQPLNNSKNLHFYRWCFNDVRYVSIQFTTCNAEEVTVQLVGFRPPPILNSE